MIDNATGGIDDPFDLVVANDILYVACRDNDTVRIFNNASALVSGAAPNVILGPSSGIDDAYRVTVLDGDLYVSDGNNDFLAIFRDATTLVSGQAPDVVLGGPSLLDRPMAPVLGAGRLFVASRFDTDIGPDDFGVSIFNNANALTSGQVADARLSTPFEEPHNLDAAGGMVIGASNTFDFVFVLRNPATVSNSTTAPDLAFFDPRGGQPVSLRAVER